MAPPSRGSFSLKLVAATLIRDARDRWTAAISARGPKGHNRAT